MFIISLHMDWLFSRGQGEATRRITQYLARDARHHTAGKPLVVALRQYNPNPLIRTVMDDVKRILLDAGIPFFDGIPRAAAALGKIAKYHRYQ